ncbi:MAG: NAD(P)H-binding protein [Gammaproteobacteria bacterium]
MQERKAIRALVAGAMGYIGGGVAHALHSAGISVRALTRDARRFTPACSGDEIFVGEATQPESLRGACDGAEVVFSSIGIRNLGRRPSIWDVDYQGNIDLLEEAKRAGVRHFIFVSVIHGLSIARTSSIAKARENVARAIIDSGIPYTIYRPTGFFNDMAEFLHAADKRGSVRLLGTGEGLTTRSAPSTWGTKSHAPYSPNRAVVPRRRWAAPKP